MMPTFLQKLLTCSLFLLSISPGITSSVGQMDGGENLHGYYAREGNNSSASSAAGNNIYIKFFEDQWIAMLYIPYPYANDIESATINTVFDAAKKQVSSSAYIRGTFGQLTERATLQFERYGYLDDRIVFECGSMSPCTINFSDGYLELIKPGVINEHIIKYSHLTSQ